MVFDFRDIVSKCHRLQFYAVIEGIVVYDTVVIQSNICKIVVVVEGVRSYVNHFQFNSLICNGWWN